jgi:flagellar biosynthetic protein FliR
VRIDLDFEWIEAVMLAGVRMVAFIVVAPPFSSNAFPLRIKGMLALGLAVAVAPVVTPGYVSPDTGSYVVSLVLELVVGAVLGFLVMIVFSAIQSAGNLIDLFGGFTLAQGFDPQLQVNGAQFTRLFQMTALALMFASGGYQLVIGGLASTFTAIPIGGGLDLAVPVEAIAMATGQMLMSALQIAGPMIVVLFLADAGLGLLTRVAPALNAFALGFPIKILLTLLLVPLLFVALPEIVNSITKTAVGELAGVR